MQVVGINKLLSDIYKRDMRLSYLLTELDFCSKEIELINRKLLPNTVACFLNTIEKATRPRIAEMPKGKRIKTAIADV